MNILLSRAALQKCLMYPLSGAMRYFDASYFSYCGKKGESCISGKNIRSHSCACLMKDIAFSRFLSISSYKVICAIASFIVFHSFLIFFTILIVVRSFTTSPAINSPAMDGTNATLPGISLRSVHLCFVPGGQIQCVRQLIDISSSGLVGFSSE